MPGEEVPDLDQQVCLEARAGSHRRAQVAHGEKPWEVARQHGSGAGLAADSEPGAVFFLEELFDKLFGSEHHPVAEIPHPESQGFKECGNAYQARRR
jgi:hypothetical protein